MTRHHLADTVRWQPSGKIPSESLIPQEVGVQLHADLLNSSCYSDFVEWHRVFSSISVRSK